MHTHTHSRIEQRRHPRLRVDQLCKIIHHPSGQFIPARVCEISMGGALIRVRGGGRLAPGDSIGVLIAWERQPVLRARDQAQAVVRRMLDLGDGNVLVGVEYAAPAVQSQAA